MIPAQQARKLILATKERGETVRVPILEAHGKVLAASASSQVSLPPFDTSAMDGFALRLADTMAATASNPLSLPIAFEVAAGRLDVPALPPGQACRIMTGAPLPSGAKAVIKLEEVMEEGGRIVLQRPARPLENIRRSGEDVKKGACLLEPGEVLTAPRVALLAAVGLETVEVYRPLRVAILTTGDELVEPGQSLQPGQIYDSNAYAMMAMVQEAGGIPVRLGPCSDDPEQTRALLEQALQADMVLTSGGVSMGRFDFVGAALAELGTVHFNSVAQQPGKPFTYATVAGKPVFGLPGNPVATMVTFEYYVRPLMRQLMGQREIERPRALVTLEEPIKQNPEKQLFLRAILRTDGKVVRARLTGGQGSHMITSMARANALLVIPPGSRKLEASEQVEAILLDSLAVPIEGHASESFIGLPLVQLHAY